MQFIRYVHMWRTYFVNRCAPIKSVIICYWYLYILWNCIHLIVYNLYLKIKESQSIYDPYKIFMCYIVHYYYYIVVNTFCHHWCVCVCVCRSWWTGATRRSSGARSRSRARARWKRTSWWVKRERWRTTWADSRVRSAAWRPSSTGWCKPDAGKTQ